jgi:integrase
MPETTTTPQKPSPAVSLRFSSPYPYLRGESVFPGVNGNMVSMAFRRAVKRAGVQAFRFHDLRHTFASWLRMAGHDIGTIQKLLGHKDLRMTIRYENLPTEFDREAVEGLDGILGESEK